MPTVGLVGVGLIGRAWANVFSRAGWEVRLWDPVAAALAAAPGLIAQSLEDVARPRPRQGPGGGGQAHHDGCVARGGRAGCGAGGRERAGAGRRQDRVVRAPRRGGAGKRHPGLVLLGHRHLALHGEAERPPPLPGRASGQPAARGADRRAVRRTLDLAGDDRAGTRHLRQRRPGADRGEARDRRVHPQPHAGGAAVGGHALGRRGLRVGRGPRQDHLRRAGLADGRSWARSRPSS